MLSNDPVFTTDSMVMMTSAYVPLNHDPMKEAYISPVYAECLQGLPPTFVLTDQDDPVSDEGAD